jgi:hypothetical protein
MLIYDKIVKGIAENGGKKDFQQKKWVRSGKNSQIEGTRTRIKTNYFLLSNLVFPFFLVSPSFRAEFDVTEQKSCRYT